MAGTIEDLDDRKTAEAMKAVLDTIYPGQKFTLGYISRSTLLEYDEHRIVRGGWFRFYFGGEIVVRYFGDSLAHVFDEKVRDVIKEKFFTPEMQQEKGIEMRDPVINVLFGVFFLLVVYTVGMVIVGKYSLCDSRSRADSVAYESSYKEVAPTPRPVPQSTQKAPQNEKKQEENGKSGGTFLFAPHGTFGAPPGSF